MRNELILSGIIVIVLSLSGCVAGNPPASTPVPPVTAAPATATPAPSPTTAPAASANIISISGVVADANGAPVPNAIVGLWPGDEATQVPEGVQHSDASGLFNFTGLQPAHYQVTADLGAHHGAVDRRFDESASITVTLSDYRMATATVSPGQGSVASGMPRFEVVRTGTTTVQVRLESFGGARSVRGFYVKSPAIGKPEIVPSDQSLGESETIEMTDPNLAGTVHFVASSRVNGSNATVVDTTV